MVKTILLSGKKALRGMGFRRVTRFPYVKRFPYQIILKEFDTQGVKFEVSAFTEFYRIEDFGEEKDFIRLILNELQHDDVFFDIGACVGLIALHAARRVKHVVAFEPDPCYGVRLDVNLQLNHLSNVQVVRWAVSDQVGMVELFADGLDGHAPSFHSRGNVNVVEVPCDTIDAAIGRKEFPGPDVLKIDIEGAEILALRGMVNLLSLPSHPRAIFLETHPSYLPGFGSSEKEVLDILLSHGYRIVHKSSRGGNNHYYFASL